MEKREKQMEIERLKGDCFSSIIQWIFLEKVQKCLTIPDPG